MKKIIFIPGTCDKEEYYSLEYPTSSNSHFFPWISKELIIRDVIPYVIENPFSFMPDYNIWKKEIERFDIDSETILVGHSCGGGFLMRYLSENSTIKPRKVYLLAPWIDPYNEKQNNFFDFTWDKDLFNENNIELIYSQDDDLSVIETVEEIKNRYEVTNILEFEDKGHFCFSNIGDTFPELLTKLIDDFKSE